MSHLNVWILAFSTNFCPIKTDLSGNTSWPQAWGFQKLAKIEHFGIFNDLLSFQNVNVARNVEFDFFSDFQTTCLRLLNQTSTSLRICISTWNKVNPNKLSRWFFFFVILCKKKSLNWKDICYARWYVNKFTIFWLLWSGFLVNSKLSYIADNVYMPATQGQA